MGETEPVSENPPPGVSMAGRATIKTENLSYFKLCSYVIHSSEENDIYLNLKLN